MCLLSQCSGGKMGGSEVQHHSYYAMSSRTNLVLQKNLSRKERREEKGGRRRRYHVVALLNSRKVQGDFQDRAYHFVFGSVGGFGKPRWVATEAEVLAAGTGFLRNICFSATHMEKHLPFVMFVCLLAFDGKHCEISFGALPVVNLCNVWVSNCHIYFLLSSRQVCVLFPPPLLNIEGCHT